MINVGTHSGKSALRNTTQVLRRISPHVFVLLVGGELLLLIGVLVWVLFWLTPPATPYAGRHDIRPLTEAVRARVGGAINDPLIEVRPGMNVRESNLRGLQLDGQVYYYYIEGQRNYDPLSRGAVVDEQVEVLLRDDSGSQSLVIYRIR